VASIEDFAFQACRTLKSITVRSPVPPELTDDVFDNIMHDVVIYVPVRSYFDYRTADGWKEFEHVKVFVTFYEIIALGILTALLLSAAVFIIIRKSRIKQEEERRK
jgi:hypothetical protein